LVGIADNREHCFIVPVAFTVIATYLAEGFILEELVRAAGDVGCGRRTRTARG